MDCTLLRSTHKSGFLHENDTQQCSHQCLPNETILVFMCYRSLNGTFTKDANQRFDSYNSISPIYSQLSPLFSNIIFKILFFFSCFTVLIIHLLPVFKLYSLYCIPYCKGFTPYLVYIHATMELQGMESKPWPAGTLWIVLPRRHITYMKLQCITSYINLFCCIYF